MLLGTYKLPNNELFVEIDDVLNAGHCVDPDNEMHD